jgi:hypothetical protein
VTLGSCQTKRPPRNNSYFLAEAFPKGSTTHPSYPTGHGAVAGHGIHAGIHWRSDTETSIQLRETVALSICATVPNIQRGLRFSAEFHS